MAKRKPTDSGGGYDPNANPAVNAVLQAAAHATNTVTWGNAGGGYDPTAGAGYVDDTPAPTPTPTPAGPTPTPTPTPTGPAGPSIDYAAQARAEAQRQQRAAAGAWLSNVLGMYGLGSLAGSVEGLINEWGTNTEVIAMKLRETGQYKERFKGLLGLQQRGITDVRSEAEYLQLETSYRKVFRDNGLADFLGTAGTQAEYDGIADLVGKYSLSVNEVADRVSDAQRVAANTSQEVKDAFQEYFGINESQLVAFSLDPVRTSEKMNRQANAAIAGGYAAKQALKIGAGAADQLAELAGTGDLQISQIATGITGAKAVADATKRLAVIDNIDLSNDEIVGAEFGTNAAGANKVKTLQSQERARFSGSSGFGKGSLKRGTGN